MTTNYVSPQFAQVLADLGCDLHITPSAGCFIVTATCPLIGERTATAQDLNVAVYTAIKLIKAGLRAYADERKGREKS